MKNACAQIIKDSSVLSEITLTQHCQWRILGVWGSLSFRWKWWDRTSFKLLKQWFKMITYFITINWILYFLCYLFIFIRLISDNFHVTHVTCVCKLFNSFIKDIIYILLDHAKAILYLNVCGLFPFCTHSKI